MKYTIYLAMAGMACSCNPILTLETTALHPFNKDSATLHPPMTDSAGYVLLPSTDRTVITAETVGNVSYQQTGSAIPWSYDKIASWIRGTAMENGANLVKITDFAPYRRNGLAHVYATLYRARDLQPYERAIVWSSTRKLTYADFKGSPEPPAASRSRCQFYSTTLFFCRESWIDPSSPDAARLLAYEQGNFDLAELYRRQLEADLQGVWQYSKRRDPIFQTIYAAYQAKKREYALESRHGLDSEKLAIWTKRIQNALANKTGGIDPAFAVTPIFSIRQKDSAAKALVPEPGKALVYIIRPNNVSTSPVMRVVYEPLYLCCIWCIGMNVNVYTATINDTTIGPIEGHSYCYLFVDPGDVNTSTGMNLDPMFRGLFFARAKKSTNPTITFQPGKVYYFKLVTGATWFGYAAPALQLVAEAPGRRLLHKCKLSVLYAEPHYRLYAPENGLY
jgi:hypothetical protein